MVIDLYDIDRVLAEEALPCLCAKDIHLYVFCILFLLALPHFVVEYPHKLLLILLLGKLDIAVAVLIYQLNNILIVLQIHYLPAVNKIAKS